MVYLTVYYFVKASCINIFATGCWTEQSPSSSHCEDDDKQADDDDDDGFLFYTCEMTNR